MDQLDAWLRRKRWTVALFVPLVGVSGFALRAWLGDGPWTTALGWPPLLIVVNAVMALPLAFGLRGLWGRRGLAAIIAVSVFSWVIEGIGVATGWPYGDFSYALGLEPLLFSLVPLALPLFWVPMLVNAWLLAVWLKTQLHLRSPGGGAVTWALAVLLLVTFDLIMDPGAVALGFWSWVVPGSWYGVPWVNYGGWLISGAAGIAIVAWGLPTSIVGPRLMSDGLVWGTLIAFLAFWAPINALHGQWLPVVFAAPLAVTMFWAAKADKQVRRSE